MRKLPVLWSQVCWATTFSTFPIFSTFQPPTTKAHFRGRILCWKVQFSQVPHFVPPCTLSPTWLNCTSQHKMRPRKCALVGREVEKVEVVAKVLPQRICQQQEIKCKEAQSWGRWLNRNELVLLRKAGKMVVAKALTGRVSKKEWKVQDAISAEWERKRERERERERRVPR